MIVCHNTIVDTSFGDVRVKGKMNLDQATIIKQSLRLLDEWEEEVDVERWKWEVGRLVGLEAARTTEDTRLIAGNLAMLARA